MKISILAGLWLGLIGVTPTVWAATPASGEISSSQTEVRFVSGPHSLSNPTVPLSESTPAGQVGGIDCDNFPCDDFLLTLNLPADYAQARPYDQIELSMAWPNTAEDFDIFVINASGQTLVNGSRSLNPELIRFSADGGVRELRLRVKPTRVAGGSAEVTARLVRIDAPQAQGLPPRFRNDVSPQNLGNGAAEPTMGWNPATDRAMFISGLETLRVTFPEALEEPLPAACDAVWEDVSAPTHVQSLDPILETHQNSGRTFSTQLIGANSLFSYSDDDGANWTVGQIAPPNGGVDHQTVGAGPYPAGLEALGRGVDYAVYYCSQSVVAAFCARSDDGGMTFGPGLPHKTVADCGDIGGLHGHVQIAPDGTVYVPDRQCGGDFLSAGGVQALSVSEDAGITWASRPIPGSKTAPKDPAVGIATDGTLYTCYEGPDGGVRAAVSHDKGQSYVNEVDIGVPAGVHRTTFLTAVAGDPDRAACSFLGTEAQVSTEEFNSTEFQGLWYAYIATTYDGGLSWHTVNVTPGDPVQGWGGICTGGTTCGTGNRNLLDFNDIIIDDRGRMLLAYADGCVDNCVQDPTVNSFSDKGVIARQIGGRGLLAEFDPVEPALPAQPCLLAGQSTTNGLQLRWNAPDSGGTAISRYSVYRGTRPDQLSLLAEVGEKTDFVDTSAAPEVDYIYRVSAHNALGEGGSSNARTLRLGTDAGEQQNACAAPGLTILNDASGDSALVIGTVPHPVSGQDLMELSVFQTRDGDAPLLGFRLKTDSLAMGPLPSTSYYAAFVDPSGGHRGVRMAVDETGAVSFFSYVPGGNNNGDVDGRFIEAGSEEPAHAGSGFTADGEIVILVPPQQLGLLAAGESLLSFVAATTYSVAGSVTDTADEMPDGLARAGRYTLLDAIDCDGNLAPRAALQVSARQGNAPLLVSFDARQSADRDGDGIAAYRFDAGDGSPAVEQGSPHFNVEYTRAGFYRASVQVRDGRGRWSDNRAAVMIEVFGAARSASAAGRGGALSWWLLILGGIALLARHARRHQR